MQEGQINQNLVIRFIDQNQNIRRFVYLLVLREQLIFRKSWILKKILKYLEILEKKLKFQIGLNNHRKKKEKLKQQQDEFISKLKRQYDSVVILEPPLEKFNKASRAIITKTSQTNFKLSPITKKHKKFFSIEGTSINIQNLQSTIILSFVNLQLLLMSKNIKISQLLPKVNWKDDMEEELTIKIPHANLINKIIDPRSSPQEFFVPIRFPAQQHMKDADGFFIPLPKEDPKKKLQQQHQFQNERYQIQLQDLISIDDLGQGSSGRVIKALHRPTNLLVALKTIQVVNDEKFTKQINLELETLVSCDHSNIIRCYGAFLEGAQVAIALEFMNLGTLQDVIKKQGKIPEGMLGLIAYQLLKGLDYLHRTKKIIHRDIKPSNLLINSQGEVKISDFGVSGQLLNTQDQRSTWVGTVTYMSPERFLCEPYSSNTDVWSLGLSLLECAWGVFPYPHPGTNETTHSLGFWEIKEYIVSRPAPPSPPEFSQMGADFIARCLQKDPGSRNSAAELLEHPFMKQYEDVSLQYLEGWLNFNQ